METKREADRLHSSRMVSITMEPTEARRCNDRAPESEVLILAVTT